MVGTNVSTFKTAFLSEADQEAALAGTLLPNDYTDLNPSWGWAAASASAGQLPDYVEALVEGGLKDPAIQEERLASLKQPLRPLRFLKPVASGIRIDPVFDPDTTLDSGHVARRLQAATPDSPRSSPCIPSSLRKYGWQPPIGDPPTSSSHRARSDLLEPTNRASQLCFGIPVATKSGTTKEAASTIATRENATQGNRDEQTLT